MNGEAYPFEEQLHAWANIDQQGFPLHESQQHGSLSLDFLLWLADREADAEGKEKARLANLGRRLTAIYEGLDPETLREARAREASAALRHASVHEDDSAELVQLGARWQALAERAADAALSLEAAQIAERQVSQLGAGVRVSRAQSSVALIGRKAFGEGDSPQPPPLGPADPASRILEALLAVEDVSERLALLPEAFKPPDVGQVEGLQGHEDEEQLFTSPAGLLQAIDLALSRLEEQAVNQQPRQVPPWRQLEGSTRNFADVREDLLALRNETFNLWEASSRQ